MTDAKLLESVSPEGLRARADTVRDKLNDGGSCARHLELAADEIERLHTPSVSPSAEARGHILTLQEIAYRADVQTADALGSIAAFIERTAAPGVTEEMVERGYAAWNSAPGSSRDAIRAALIAALSAPKEGDGS